MVAQGLFYCCPLNIVHYCISWDNVAGGVSGLAFLVGLPFYGSFTSSLTRLFTSLRESLCNLTPLPRRIWQIQANSVVKNESWLLFNLYFSHIGLASHSYAL